MAILGHGTNTVAANYGSGYAIEVMRDHMEKARDSRDIKTMETAQAFNPFLVAKSGKLKKSTEEEGFADSLKFFSYECAK